LNEKKPNLYHKKEIKKPPVERIQPKKPEPKTSLTFAVKAEGKPTEYLKQEVKKTK
jgi:hypothetical protein